MGNLDGRFGERTSWLGSRKGRLKSLFFPMTLILTYFTGDRRGVPASFDILVDGTRIAEERVERSEPSRFVDVEHRIPGGLVQGKQKVTIRFQAKTGSQVATLFGLRVIRGDAER